jgi:hypothetical protein
MKSIINNEKDTKEYMEKYTTTNEKQRVVRISSRTIYHKFCEIEIEIPKDLKEDEVADWLFENENKWTDDLSQANGEAILNFGFGLGDGMDDKDEEHEMRYDIVGENYGGHI